MTTSIQSKNSTQSAILVNGVEAAVFDAKGISGIAGLNGGQLAGTRNRIINGGMQVNQRGLTSIVVSSITIYLVDRFSHGNSTGGGTQIASTSTNTDGGVAKPSLRLTATASPTNLSVTNYWHGINQTIEGFNSADLKGKTVTVSFLFLSNITGNISFALRDGTQTNSYITTFACVAGVTQRVSITVALPTSLTIPYSNAAGLLIAIGFLNTGTYQTSTFNAWQSGNYVSASGATNWAATAGNYIDITELQLELGTVATPFEHRPYGLELMLCQRYYEQTTVAPLWSGMVTSGNNYYHITLFKTTKRAIPTLVVGYMGSSGFPAVAPSASPQIDGVQLSNTANSTGLGSYFQYSLTASAEL